MPSFRKHELPWQNSTVKRNSLLTQTSKRIAYQKSRFRWQQLQRLINGRRSYSRGTPSSKATSLDRPSKSSAGTSKAPTEKNPSRWCVFATGDATGDGKTWTLAQVCMSCRLLRAPKISNLTYMRRMTLLVLSLLLQGEVQSIHSRC